MDASVADKLRSTIDAHARDDIARLLHLAKYNSGTFNVVGLDQLSAEITAMFAEFRDVKRERITLPPAENVDANGNVVTAPLGDGLRFVKQRANATNSVFLCIHYDTVYGVDHPFQSTRWLDDNTLNGPGVCDAKGGLIVMLSAIRAIEHANVPLNWEVYLGPDEEIGSPGSSATLRDAAERHQFGLLFEPALADGSLVGQRKGSGNFTVVVRGRAAHAGRDFKSGRSATVALAEIITRFDTLNTELGGDVTINCGNIAGGGAVNVVPDLAIGRFNVRIGKTEEMLRVLNAQAIVLEEFARRDGINVIIHGGFASPPKPFDDRTRKLFDLARECGKEVGLDLQHKPSGGTCDGNKLAAAGMTCLDSLGPVGGDIHSDREFVRVDTIAQRAKLTALLLYQLALRSPLPPGEG